MKIALLVTALTLLRNENLRGQTVGPPVMVPGASVVYPAIARAAHVSGEVVVRFIIEDDGTTSSVNVISGPLMLQAAVTDRIKAWRFKTPLPTGAEREFEAVYGFGVDPANESGDDDLDSPPFIPCCGDSISLPVGASKVGGRVHSVDGDQTIMVKYAPLVPTPSRCPQEKEKIVPDGSDPDDYAEFFRACHKGCRDYKARVYRNGRVEWLGRDDVAVTGWLKTLVPADAAEKLLEKFRTPAFWSACSADSPPPSLDDNRDDENFMSADFLSVKIGNHAKTVNATSGDDALERLKWAIDRTANTHQWIHGEGAREPYLNMASDVGMPKQGMTALIRATYHSSHLSGLLTTDALKRLLAAPDLDVEAADESGWTALMYAAELTQDDEEIGLLLDAHANPDRPSLHGDTPLMMAAYGGRLSRRLLEAGADINVSNADGVNVLMLLAQHMNANELQMAIAAGADVTAKDAQGRTALDYLLQASCRKAIVSLPQPWMSITYKDPLPCPSKTEEYSKSETVLKSALKQSGKNQ